MNRDDAELYWLIDLLEPGEGAWSDLRRAEAYYRLPQEGDMQQRLARLLAALWAELEASNPKEADKLRRASDAHLFRELGRLASFQKKRQHQH